MKKIIPLFTLLITTYSVSAFADQDFTGEVTFWQGQEVTPALRASAVAQATAKAENFCETFQRHAVLESGFSYESVNRRGTGYANGDFFTTLSATGSYSCRTN